MGANKRIKELEADVAWWRAKSEVASEVRDYLKTLAEMPEDSVLLYTLSGQRIQHSIGKSARVLLEKM